MILIVDDSEMVRNYYYYILKNRGLNVMSAIDGADALEKLLKNTGISMVITDINMPNMDGYTLIERIREMPEFSSLPIIIISTEDEAVDKRRGFLAGANLYVVKPIEPDTLVEHIHILLEEQS